MSDDPRAPGKATADLRERLRNYWECTADCRPPIGENKCLCALLNEAADALGALLATMKFDGWQWQPIATLPEEDKLVMAWVPDGRMMIWRTTILRSALEGAPSHLQFPATHWREMPSGPATANTTGDTN